MSFINTSTGVFIFINGQDVSQYLIEGSLSDESVYTNNIITTTGQIILGTSSTILDFNRTTYPIGSKIRIWVKLDNGKIALHPKGTLYIINSTVSPENQTLTLDVGCSLAFLSDKEESYTEAVESLFGLLNYNAREYFTIERKDLSTLSNLLEVVGQIIYQDQYGNIQSVSAFGSDGLGFNATSSKLTSFDKYTAISIESISETAIESNISAIIVTSNIDVPRKDEEDEPGPNPPPFVISETSRTIDTPSLEPNFGDVYHGTTFIEQEASPPLVSESNPSCGTISIPTETSTSIGYHFKCYGGAQIKTQKVRERVVNGGSTTYNGPGNQVDYEDKWEYCSASTWASSAINKSMNDYLNMANRFLAEANALLSKMNQNLDARDQASYGSNKYKYYNCIAASFLTAANQAANNSKEWVRAGSYLGVDANATYAVSNLTRTFNSYDSTGALIKTITRNYQQPTAWDGSAIWRIIEEQNNQYSEETGLMQESLIPNGPVTNPDILNLRIANENIKVFNYSALYNTETEESIDYQNPDNSYKRINHSSSNSSNPEQPDRLAKITNVDGEQYCSADTDNKELTAIVRISSGAVGVDSGWFGIGRPYEKKVDFPATFKPILPIYNSVSHTCSQVNSAGAVAKYEQLIRFYAIVLAKKITGDNRGFRITEKLRAEIFEYYPFYPVTISVESIGRAFKARVAASNWVFDTESAVCSFDCLITADIPQPIFTDPSVKAVYIKTDSAKTLSPVLLKISSTAQNIQIKTLPPGGSLALSGTAVTIGQIISVANIQNNLLIFTPTQQVTTDIEFTYTAIDSAGAILSSVINIYPPITTTPVTLGGYHADGGDFTLNTSANGFNLNSGDFNAAGEGFGPAYMDSGDFDIGGSITLPAPPLPPGTPISNGSVDPEAVYGITVKNASNNSIATSSLSTAAGQAEPIFDIIIDFDIKVEIVKSLLCLTIENNGWGYGSIGNPLGTNINMGTIIDPNEYSLNFGTIVTANEPVLQSAVV